MLTLNIILDVVILWTLLSKVTKNGCGQRKNNVSFQELAISAINHKRSCGVKLLQQDTVLTSSKLIDPSMLKETEEFRAHMKE